MKINIEVEVATFKPTAATQNNQVQLDAARNLIEAVATAVSTRQADGTIEHTAGSATFKVLPDAKGK